MKKISLFVFVVILIAAGSVGCKKIIRNIFKGVDAEVPVVDLTLPPIPYAYPYEVPFPSIIQTFNLDSSIRASTGGAFGAGDVSSIKVKQIVFDLTNADSLNNISNFESVRVTFLSNVDTDTLTIASINFPDTYATSYTYTPVNSAELKPYLSGSKLIYNVYGKIRRITTKALGLSIKVTLRVE